VTSAKGVGSEFWFSIKVEKSAITAESTRPKAEPVLPRNSRPLRILVAEDNAVNQRLVKKILEAAGHQVVLADNGKKAVDAFMTSTNDPAQQTTPFDIILMDIQMPEMGGVEATKLIRAEQPEKACALPIIAVTANAMPEHKDEYLAAGMDYYLTKPINRLELLKVVSEAASGARLHETAPKEATTDPKAPKA
jgi:CheY-like chemotaxis protein